jgi:hypothetical protein
MGAEASSRHRSGVEGRKLLRQAKPDGVFTFVRPQEITDAWPAIERYLETSRPFWVWLLGVWERQGSVRRAPH